MYEKVISNTIVVGDVHGQWDFLRKIIERTKCKTLFQVGDFGYFPRWSKPIVGEHRYSLDLIPTDLCEIHFVDGNHEDHESLNILSKNSFNQVEISKNLIYHPRGSFIDYLGSTILFMGGALSIDRGMRTQGYDWFSEEVISPSILYKLPQDKNVDIVISHTAPKFLLEKIQSVKNITVDDFDSSMGILDGIFEMYRPKKWFFGHWHMGFKHFQNGCEFICLDKLAFRDVSFGIYTDLFD